MRRVVLCSAMVLALGLGASGCGESTTGDAGAGGSGGTAGSGGAAGSGGTAGGGGMAGTGGAGGIGGAGGSGECVTNNLCTACPDRFVCPCFVGWGCAPSGCTDPSGASLDQCIPIPGTGRCAGDDDCPTPSAPSPDYSCENVVNVGLTCVRQVAGCATDADCVPGFSCEGGGCVDRRVPCVFDADCPVNYACEQPTVNNRFCFRIHQSCTTEIDCGIITPFCADVDGDGLTECVGPLDLNGPPCRNSSCGGAAPVCEASSVGSIAACGQYGLCRSNDDCADATFECRSLWPDGRRECMKRGGSCSSIEDCPLNQVCAVARTGGAPSCQSGVGL